MAQYQQYKCPPTVGSALFMRIKAFECTTDVHSRSIHILTATLWSQLLKCKYWLHSAHETLQVSTSLLCQPCLITICNNARTWPEPGQRPVQADRASPGKPGWSGCCCQWPNLGLYTSR
jgi:hypothetical protein